MTLRFHPIRSIRLVIAEGREFRGETARWAKSKNFVDAQLNALKGLVFWNTIENNKLVRQAPWFIALFAAYTTVSLWLRTFSTTELGVLLFGSVLWYAIEMVNSTFEYLLDELHGRRFDPRYARIKDMGAAASQLMAFALVVAAVTFCF